MRGLLAFILGFCLLAGLATGAVAHAVELGSNGEMTAATEWLHAEGDHDQVPADADGKAPHHHGVCHGHELGVAMKAVRPALTPSRAAHRPDAEAPPPGAAPATPLRPPIA